MADTIPTLSRGMPVEIGRIDRELKNLWEQAGGATTRASLINFAVYCEGSDAMAANTELIAAFTRDHACRAILIAIEPEASTQKVQAWISAHCHISREGAKQVCCEQITFFLEGDTRELIPNIVFSHLDSDLPLYLWWRADFPEAAGDQLWTWVDRLIFDSRTFAASRMQLDRIRSAVAKTKRRLTLSDLNWTRSRYLRQAIAQTFDYPENVAELAGVDHVMIAFDPASRSSASLFAGWLAAQLGCELSEPDGHRVAAVTPGSGRKIDIDFHEAPGAPLSQVELFGPGMSFRFTTDAKSDFLHTFVRLPDGREYHNLLPSVADNELELLNEELMRGGGHHVYLRALSTIEPLL